MTHEKPPTLFNEENLSYEDIEAINTWEKLLSPSPQFTIFRDIYLKEKISPYREFQMNKNINWIIRASPPYASSISAAVYKYKMDLESIGYFGDETLNLRGLCNLDGIETKKNVATLELWKIIYSLSQDIWSQQERKNNVIPIQVLIPWEIYGQLICYSPPIFPENMEYDDGKVKIIIYPYKTIEPYKKRVIIYHHDETVISMPLLPLKMLNKIKEGLIFYAYIEGIELYKPQDIRYLEIDGEN